MRAMWTVTKTSGGKDAEQQTEERNGRTAKSMSWRSDNKHFYTGQTGHKSCPQGSRETSVNGSANKIKLKLLRFQLC